MKLTPRLLPALALAAAFCGASPAQDAEPKSDVAIEDAANAVKDSPYKAAFEKARKLVPVPDGVDLDPEAVDAIASFVLGNTANTAFHEMGHALVSELGFNVLGKEEDAVDAFANLIMVARQNDPELDRMIVSVADGYFKDGQFADEASDPSFAWDEHSLNAQRAFAVICILVGAEPAKFKDAADNAGMPPERQESCQSDWASASTAWDNLLAPWSIAKGAKVAKSHFVITYDTPKPEYAKTAAFLKGSAIIEGVLKQMDYLVAWPGAPIGVKVTSCGESNAYWSPDERELTICYEIVQGYVDSGLSDYVELEDDVSQEPADDEETEQAAPQ